MTSARFSNRMPGLTINQETLDKVVKLACEAGAAVMEVYGREDFGTVLKEDNSPLTLADKRSHGIIEKGLRSLFPDIPVLSEESKEIPFEQRKDWSEYWLVDPLDGTKEFISRNGEFCINIALIRNGKPVLGVVYAPVLRDCYFAADGMGAFKCSANGMTNPARVLPYHEGPLKVVASRSHAGGKLKGFLDKVQPAEIVNMGSALKLCLVAEGKAHLYPRLGPTMEWDIAAGHAVVVEAGGDLSDLSSHPLKYNKEDLRNPYFVAYGKPCYPWQPLAPLMQ